MNPPHPIRRHHVCTQIIGTSLVSLMMYVLTTSTAFSQMVGRSAMDVNLSSIPYHISYFGSGSGLPQQQILGMHEEPINGTLVFSTANGIIEYDGNSFKPYRNASAYGSLVTYTGLFKTRRYESLLGLNLIGELYELRMDQPVLIGTFTAVDIGETYIATIDRNGQLQFEEFTETTSIDVNKSAPRIAQTGVKEPVHLTWLGMDRFLIATANESFLYQSHEQRLQRILADGIRHSTYSAEEKSHFVATRRHLYRLDDGRVPTRIPLQVVDRSGDITIMDVESLINQLLITTSEGLFIVKDGRAEHYNGRSILPTDRLTGIFRNEEQQTVFIGTENKGLLKLIPKALVNVGDSDARLMSPMGPIVRTSDGILASSFNNLMRVTIGGELSSLPLTLPEAGISALSLIEGVLHIGHWSGHRFAITLSDGSILNEQRDDDALFAVFRDREGYYWFGMSYGVERGDTYYSSTPFKRDSIQGTVKTFFESRNGDLWIGMMDGLAVLDSNRQIKHLWKNGDRFPSLQVRAFMEDSNGTMWVGTYGGGLLALQNGELISLRERPNYRLGDEVFTLARDRFGFVLMTSNDGLRIVHETALSSFLDGSLDYLIPYVHREQSGLLNTEFNGGFLNNHVNVGDSLFYFPSMEGVVRYESQKIEMRPSRLRVHQISVDGAVYSELPTIPRKTQYIRVDFSDVNYREYLNLHYQYRLLSSGRSTPAWSVPQVETSLTLSNLGPGEYTLQIRSVNGANDPDPIVRSVLFTIPPRLYERASVQILAMISGLAMIGFLYRRRLLIRQRSIQRDLEMGNALKEVELTAIHSQMNPHLIFNLLSVLIHLIRRKELGEAERFTINFSKLLRNVLDNSHSLFTAIGQEVESLNTYLSIQKVRHRNEFVYHIRCAPSLHSLQMPAMILQPLVENAIHHGIGHSTNTGVIDVVFSRSDRDLLVTISDNGVGLKASEVINKGRDYDSKGLSLVHRKIELLRSRYGIQVDFDLREKGNGEGPGTIATVRIADIEGIKDPAQRS